MMMMIESTGSLISADESARPHTLTHITTSTRREGSIGFMNRDMHSLQL